jgi:predicted membrane channel-forming protein YqfA (hemolysin III family)
MEEDPIKKEFLPYVYFGTLLIVVGVVGHTINPFDKLDVLFRTLLFIGGYLYTITLIAYAITVYVIEKWGSQ